MSNKTERVNIFGFSKLKIYHKNFSNGFSKCKPNCLLLIKGITAKVGAIPKAQKAQSFQNMLRIFCKEKQKVSRSQFNRNSRRDGKWHYEITNSMETLSWSFREKVSSLFWFIGYDLFTQKKLSESDFNISKENFDAIFHSHGF